MPTIDRTIALIKQAHTGQTTRSGDPYWRHPVRVMERLPPWSSAGMKHAALLHDVLEKTSITESDLASRGYSDWVIGAVRTLSRPSDEPYEDWIQDLAATADALIIVIKLADLEDHLDPREIDKTPEANRPDYSKYEKAQAVLLR